MSRLAYEVSGTAAQRVEIGVYSVTGRLVKTLVNDVKAPSRYVTSWDGRTNQGELAHSGMYFVRILVGGQKITTRMLLMQ